MSYTTTIGITVFGEPTGYSSNTLISEFKSFIESRTLFNIQITSNIYPAVSINELYSWDNGLTFGLAPWTLSINNRNKLPLNVQMNMILYDWLGKPPAFGGGMFGGDVGINRVPYIMIPLGAWGAADTDPCASWSKCQSQTLVHEWMHGLDWILEQQGYPQFHSSDTCTDYGYTEINDPGWVNCLTFFLSEITPVMYEAIQNWNKPLTCNPLHSQLQL